MKPTKINNRRRKNRSKKSPLNGKKALLWGALLLAGGWMLAQVSEYRQQTSPSDFHSVGLNSHGQLTEVSSIARAPNPLQSDIVEQGLSTEGAGKGQTNWLSALSNWLGILLFISIIVFFLRPKQKSKNRSLRQVRAFRKFLVLWISFLLVGSLFFWIHESHQKTFAPDFNYPKFVQALSNEEIQKDSVIFNTKKQEITGALTAVGAQKHNGTRFRIQGNVSEKGFELLEEKGIIPDYVNTDNTILLSFILNWIPIFLLIGVFTFFFRQVQAGGGKVLSFGKSKARLISDKQKVTFNDVAGVEEAKEELKEIVHFLKNPKKFTRLGGRIPKGVLLIGSPGTGKTLLAKAVAGEAKAPFFTISGSDFVEMFVGVGASRVRHLFLEGRRHAPCVIFVDEIDAVGRHRGAGMGGGHDEREQTLNQLLVEMDGIESHVGIIMIAATNRPDVLDPALLRPGRFDRRVVVNVPDLKGRQEILKVHTRKVPLSRHVNLEKIARGTPGFSGADLENLVNESALMAASLDKEQIEMPDIEKAKDKVLMGRERRSMVISEKDREITAYHEAGHTLVGKKLPNLDPVHKVTIIPRGMALGLTQTLPKEDTFNLSKSKAENTLAFLFGGRAAEELIFKDYTTGAGNDIEKATDLARRMVCEWGMSEKLGPLTLEKREDPVFLGMQYSKGREYSEAKAKEVDQEVHRLISHAYQQALNILKTHRPILDTMAKALLKYETITGEEVDMMVKGAGLTELEKHRKEMDQVLKKERAEQKAQKKREAKERAQKVKEEGASPSKLESIGKPEPVF